MCAQCNKKKIIEMHEERSKILITMKKIECENLQKKKKQKERNVKEKRFFFG